MVALKDGWLTCQGTVVFRAKVSEYFGQSSLMRALEDVLRLSEHGDFDRPGPREAVPGGQWRELRRKL